MEKRLVTEAERLLNSRHQNKRRTQVIRGLALLVVLATISALMLPAITMSNEVECGMEEHIHTENCYAVQQVAPQPVLVCTEGQSGEMLIHIHDSFCYDSQGNLICTLPEVEAHTHGPECYQERRTLICTETSDPGHQHEASCYSYVKVENAAISMDMMAPVVTNEYVCGMQEGEGAHQHTDGCYPKERTQRLICAEQESDEDVTDEEGNVLIPAHRHNSGCYEVQETPVFERFICTQEESDDEYDSGGNLIRQGHRHDGSCWLRGDELCYQEGCRQHESSGHQHTDACIQAASQESIRVDGQGEQWEQTLVCQEPEREPGHIHTDVCYEVTQVLACQKAELEVHTHDASCEDENGALICGKTEIRAHQHTDACFVVPEGGPEEAEVLTCGMEEHTHTDLCYVKTQPETEKFYCGMEEHIHTTECEFSSGALKCTIPEHYHIDTCLAPPVEESEEPGESPGPEESQLPEDVVEVKDVEFVYQENPAFVVTFKVNGFARVAGDQPEQLPQDGGPVFSGEELTEIIDQAVPLAAMPRMMSMMALVDDMPSSGPDLESSFTPTTTTDETDSTAAPGSDTEPGGTAVENSSQTTVPPVISQYVPEPSREPIVKLSDEPIFSMAVESVEPSQDVPEVPVEFYVEELGEDDPEYQTLVETIRKTQEMEDTWYERVVRIKGRLGDKELDLSQCQVTALMEPTDSFRQYVKESGENVMAAVEDDPTMEDMEAAVKVQTVMTLATQEGIQSVVLLDEGSETGEPEEVEVSPDKPMLLSAGRQPFPNFKVEYYAYLEKVDDDQEKEKTLTVGQGAIKIIDTSNQRGTPTNNGELSTKNLYVESDGSIITKKDLVRIYKTHSFNYATAPGLQYFNIVVKENSSDSYQVKEVWTKTESADDWMKYEYTETTRFTNWDEVADRDSNYILVENGMVIRLIYEPKTDKRPTYDAQFYDYDISDGEIYDGSEDSSDKSHHVGTTVKNVDRSDPTTTKPTSANKWYVNVFEQGINSSGNYTNASGKTKLAFGNSLGIMPTGLGNLKWGANTPNMTGADQTLKCTFEIVTGLEGGKLVYNNGIVAPNLFNDGSAAGKTTYNKGSLTFIQTGDTYTLTSATAGSADGGNNSSTNNLHKLYKDRWNWNKTVHLYSNEFWPMDRVDSAGTNGHDPIFGAAGTTKNYSFFGKGENGNEKSAPESDYGTDHNAYFGMHSSIKFEVSDNYTGPLEYYFFGDDDMWVFLSPCDENGNYIGDSTLICDIGGVHPSVGEYVDLWDYVDPDRNKDETVPAKKEDGTDNKGDVRSYRLDFFYTERGASGSTCWMQFTLPTVVGLNLEEQYDENTGSLMVAKKVEGISEDSPFGSTQEFQFKITLEGTHNLTEVKTYKKLDSGETVEVQEAIGSEKTFALRDGESLWLMGLPIGTEYTVEEAETSRKGFATSYQTTVTKVNEDGTKTITVGDEQTGWSVDGKIESGNTKIETTFINRSSYELPSTGGPGVWYTMAGVPLAALFCLMYKKKSQGEGAVDQ